MSGKDLSILEKTIDYKFNNQKFLKIALTHKSYLDEQSDFLSNQRYEFLGDTILDFDLTLYLFNNFPDLDEGNLTKIRSSAVDQSSLVALGKNINIGDFIFLSKAEDASGGRHKKSIIEDAVEALIAAIYFDGGLESVNKFVSKYIYPNIKELSQDPGKKDYKTRLQEYYAKIGKKVTYENKSRGPDHSKEFSSKVLLLDKVIGTGKGKSKKNEEQIKPNIEDSKVKQVSEFEKKELFDPNNIAALIDKSKEEFGETNKKLNKITQSQDSSMDSSKLTLSEEDALKAQIFGCWSIPLGLPYNEDLLVRIKLKLKPDGTLIKTEILDHARMNMPGQGFFKVLAESALRAIQLCQPLKVPTSGYERWKDLQLNFDAREMLGG